MKPREHKTVQARILAYAQVAHFAARLIKFVYRNYGLHLRE